MELIKHPSELENDREIAFVSMKFWTAHTSNTVDVTDEVLVNLLFFQQGWKACKTFYNLND